MHVAHNVYTVIISDYPLNCLGVFICKLAISYVKYRKYEGACSTCATKILKTDANTNAHITWQICHQKPETLITNRRKKKSTTWSQALIAKKYFEILP